MDYITVRELREKSGEVWQRIEAGEEMVVTRNGKPIAVLLHTPPAQVEMALQAHRAARMGAVLQRLHAQAKEGGADVLSDDEIDAEIRAARADDRSPGEVGRQSSATRRR